jgi:hypothetical protein
MPDWIIAQDILVKAKDGLRIMALGIYRKEIRGKSVALEGKLIHLPDEPKEDDEDLFVMGKLAEDRDNIGRTYQEYIAAASESGESGRVSAAERARKFLLALGHMLMVMDYSDLFDGWIEDAGMLVAESSPSRVIAASSNGEGRADALRFVVEEKKFLSEGVLNSDEHKILQDALELIGKKGS